MSSDGISLATGLALGILIGLIAGGLWAQRRAHDCPAARALIALYEPEPHDVGGIG